jgi:hypothetical protein
MRQTLSTIVYFNHEKRESNEILHGLVFVFFVSFVVVDCRC